MPGENDDNIGMEALAGQSLEELLNPTQDALDTSSTSASDDGKKDDDKSSTAITSESVEASIRKATEALEERLSEVTQRLEYTRGQLAERDARKPDATDDADDDGKFKYDPEAIAAEMATDAPAALQKFSEGLITHEIKKLRKELTKDVDTKLTGEQLKRQAVEQFQADRSAVTSQFAEQMKDEDFQKEANAEMANLIRNRGGTTWGDYRPGDLENAATRVALRWTRTGRMGTTSDNTNGNGNKNGLSLKEVVRRAPNENMGNGKGPKANATPKTIDELYPDSPRDRVIARKMMKEYGVPEERYVARLLKSRREDGDFVG